MTSTTSREDSRDQQPQTEIDTPTAINTTTVDTRDTPAAVENINIPTTQPSTVTPKSNFESATSKVPPRTTTSVAASNVGILGAEEDTTEQDDDVSHLCQEVVDERHHDETLVEEENNLTHGRPSPLPPRPASSHRRPGSAASSTHNNNTTDSSPNIKAAAKMQQQRVGLASNTHGGKGGSKIRARFVVEDPEKVCGMHVEQCDKRIELLQRRIADLEEMERKGASKLSLSHSKTIDPRASFASLSTKSPYGDQSRGWKPKAQISPDDEGKMLERLTRPKQDMKHEDILIGNRFRSRNDEDNAPIDELDDEERAARIQEMVGRLAGDDVSMRATNREERLEREAPNAPQEQWKGVVATLREGRRRFNRIMKGGADEEEEEGGLDEENEDGDGPFRLSIEKQEALAQRLCNESLQKKQEGIKELTKKFYGDDVARRKDGVLGDHYQATGMCLPYEVGTIAAKTSKSPYRRYGGVPSIGPSSRSSGGGGVRGNRKLNTSSPFGEDSAAHTTPLRLNNSSHVSSPVAVGGKLPPLLSPVVARRLQREEKTGSPERKPTPAELGKRLHDDSRAHFRETQKELESKYLVNPLTRATQFADAGATGSSVVEKPLKYITPDEVKALGDRLCQPVSRGPK